MHVPEVSLHRPATIGEASALLERLGPGARAMAGGTDLIPDLRNRRLPAGHVVMLEGIPGLRGIKRSEDGLDIGALTTLQELAESETLGGPYAIIREAAASMASAQVRNLATAGGNIAGAVPCADLPPVFMVLDATVMLASAGSARTMPLAGFYRGPREAAIRPDEILTLIRVPAPPPGFGAAQARFGLRDGNTIAVASVAASLRLDPAGLIRAALLGLGAVAPTPRLVRIDALTGRRADEAAMSQAARAAMEAAHPISDIRGSAGWRRQLVGVLARRALAGAAARAGGGRP